MTTPTLEETSNDIWNSNGKITHNELDAKLSVLVTTAKREALQEVAGGIFNRCNQLRMEIANQEEEHGLVDTSTLDRLNEAEKMYAELSTLDEAITIVKELLTPTV